MRFGKIGHRAFARFIDYLVVIVVITLLRLLWSEHLMRLSAGFLVSVLFQIAFTSIFLSRRGSTPRKMLFNLKVVTLLGNALGQGRALAQQFAESLSPYTFFVGYLIAAFDRSRQQRTLRDRICGTRLVYQ